MTRPAASRDRAPAIATPGILLGTGLGGFLDGIVLHQILQWHQMLSTTQRWGETTVENMQVNMVADGLFHLVTWAFVAVGVALLWRATREGAGQRNWRSLFGWILFGWGVFNVVEGVINHHLLEIHRVHPEAANPLVWDVGFLAFGVVLLVAGWLIQRRDPGCAGASAGRAALG